VQTKKISTATIKYSLSILLHEVTKLTLFCQRSEPCSPQQIWALDWTWIGPDYDEFWWF